MKRNPGERLRRGLLHRLLDAALLGMTATGWLLGAGLVLGTTRG